MSTYDPNKSTLHIIGAQRQPERQREEVTAKAGRTPQDMPEVVIPHRGVTIRVIQGAMAHYHKEHPGSLGIFRLILEGVCIGQLSIQTGR